MSSIMAALYDKLTEDHTLFLLLADRVYPLRAPAAAARPFLVYQRLDEDHVHHLGNGTQVGHSGLADGLYQVTAWADVHVDAYEVAEAVRDTLDTWHTLLADGTYRSWTLQRAYETIESAPVPDETEDRYGIIMEFRAWYSVATPTP